jgi:isopenicillin N synthase-like dioxygenase
MSPIHRVASPPGEQAGQTRYSIAYFSRPAQTALMKRLDSDVVSKLAVGEVQEDMTVMEWYWKEFLAKQKKHNIMALGGQS